MDVTLTIDQYVHILMPYTTDTPITFIKVIKANTTYSYTTGLVV